MTKPSVFIPAALVLTSAFTMTAHQPREKGPWEEVRDRLNAKLRGWQNYFSYGTLARAYQIGNHHVERRVRNFLRQRHQHSTKGTRRFPSGEIFGRLGVYRLARG